MTAPIILVIAAAVLLLGYAAVPRRASPACGRRGPSYVVRGPSPEEWFTLGTYNIHGGKGTDGLRDLVRTAGVIGNTDIVALQEVRAGRYGNQAWLLGDMLQLDALFAPTIHRWFRDYRGNGLLSRFPVTACKSFALPNTSGRRYRAASVSEIAIGAETLSVMFTHLHTRAGRLQQLETVLEHYAGLPSPSVLVGDFNADQEEPALGDLPAGALDALAHVLGPGDVQRVDWIITRGLEIRDGERLDSAASDHPFFRVEARIPASQRAVDSAPD